MFILRRRLRARRVKWTLHAHDGMAIFLIQLLIQVSVTQRKKWKKKQKTKTNKKRVPVSNQEANEATVNVLDRAKRNKRCQKLQQNGIGRVPEFGHQTLRLPKYV